MATNTSAVEYFLRFRSITQDGHGFSFPCDAEGHVDLDHLSPRALENYLFVRTMIGRDFFCPDVVRQVH